MPKDAPRRTSPFMDLPREIRDLIFYFLVPQRTDISNYTRRRCPAFLMVNHQIRAECFAALLKYSVFFHRGNLQPHNLLQKENFYERIHHLGISMIGSSSRQSDVEQAENRALAKFVLRLPALRTLTIDLPSNVPAQYCYSFWNLCCLYHPGNSGWLFPRQALTMLFKGTIEEVRLVYPKSLSTHSWQPTLGSKVLIKLPVIEDLAQLEDPRQSWELESFPELLAVFGQKCSKTKHEWSRHCCATRVRKSLTEFEPDREKRSLTLVLRRA